MISTVHVHPGVHTTLHVFHEHRGLNTTRAPPWHFGLTLLTKLAKAASFCSNIVTRLSWRTVEPLKGEINFLVIHIDKWEKEDNCCYKLISFSVRLPAGGPAEDHHRIAVMSLSVKAYLNPDTEEQEIRRFSVDEGASASFTYLQQKIESVFPSVRGKRTRLFWKGKYIFTDDSNFEPSSTIFPNRFWIDISSCSRKSEIVWDLQ